jgi:hypothetical protein
MSNLRVFAVRRYKFYHEDRTKDTNRTRGEACSAQVYMKMHSEHFHASLWRKGRVGLSFETQDPTVPKPVYCWVSKLNPTYILHSSSPAFLSFMICVTRSGYRTPGTNS